MTVYITIQDVDELLGDTWAAADKKGKAVLQANTWMTALNLQDIDPEHIPEEVKQAGAFIASVAAAGNLYQQKTDSGVVTSKSVEADDVKVSRTFAELSTTSTELLDPDLQRKRAARTVLTGMCYSVGSATRQGSSSLTRFIGQSAMTSRT
ncbi:protein singed [Klebsiella quasipneumoniae]|uniref:protein singed n=2 Tax=Klebsiella pneumoniae complex TaxID=3390273 RepID=UPI0020534A78|nr:protein singed [Klebsiella quasipneumoniae]UPS74597.1 protein singed [Klebsiella quasipneumoniae]